MRDLKQTGFADRLATQAEAKKALLARFKPKPSIPDPDFDRRAEKLAAEKEAARLEQAKAQTAEQMEEERRNQRRERKAAIKAEQRARRAEKKTRR